MPLPAVAPRSETAAHYDLIDALSGQASMGAPGFSAGGDGSGHATLTPINLGASSVDSLDVTPEEAGTNNHPFSTARADAYTGTTNTLYPFRASGRLFFKIGSDTFVCSASLIKRGVVVTAAHCVANYGKKQFYSGWQFVPGYRNGVAPYGVWTVKKAYVATAYYNGTDSCAVAGVVCQDDVAVLVLNASSAGAYIGTTIGWYGYGWNGYGFTSNALTEVTQIGYPVCLDSGLFMERNDSYGYRSSSNSNNTMIGSLMCGGSSGGPWLVNFGFRPTLTGTTAGTSPAPNTVIGVTSWGYVSSSPKEQGASPFLSTNIVPLVNTACTATAAAC
jgi:V8-like Glu-specific endopeptidase